MNMSSLSIAQFGDVDSLGDFLFENSVQHQLFREVLMDAGQSVPAYPLADADIDNLDDWLQAHQVEHQAFAAYLGLENPFNMLDTDWNKEDSFYDWIGMHLQVHQLIAANLGL